MNIEQNKQLARDFFSYFTSNDIVAALQMLTDDATWWIAGKPEHLPVAGLYTKDKITQLLNNLAAGDKVAVEVESYGELRNGRIYNQEYHILLTIRDGKISSVREYLDTQHVFAVWFQQ